MSGGIETRRQGFLQEAALSLGPTVRTAIVTFFESCFAGSVGTMWLSSAVR